MTEKIEKRKLTSSSIFITARDATLILVICTITSLLFNSIRKNGIPLVQKQEYEIFVPCPEPLGSPRKMTADQLIQIKGEKILIIDARAVKDYHSWHYPDSINIEFDFITPICQAKLKEIVSSKATKVIVYGDGSNPDSGYELARELSGNGIKNVYYIEGGVPEILNKIAGGSK